MAGSSASLEKTVSRNFELLQRLVKEQNINQTELEAQSMPQAPGPADSSASGLNSFPRPGQRNQVAAVPLTPKSPRFEDSLKSCALCRECGLPVAENCLFCPACSVFQGSIATEDPDGSLPELPQREPSFGRRLAGWLQGLRRRATAVTLFAAFLYLVVK